MNIFLVITPRILERLNSIKQILKTPQKLGRLCFLILIVMLIMIATFKGTFLLTSYFPIPFFPINFIFTTLFALILFSGAIITINEFFISNDLSIYLASPISNFNFFIGKIFLTIFSASWMPTLFLLPSLIAFGSYYEQSIIYYIFLPFLIFPILSIPIFIGNIFVFLFSKLIPLKVFKEILFFLYITMFLSIGVLVKNLFTLSMNPTSQLITNNMPFEWGSIFLNNLLLKNSISLKYFLLLHSINFILFLLSYVIFNKFYIITLNTISSYSSSKTINIKIFETLSYKVTSIFGITKQEILFKEYKTFLRDIGRSSQIFLLLGIAFLYFSNLKLIANFSNINNDNYIITIIISLAVCTFILIAFCSRFVFPTLSLEAKAYDIFLKSPVSLKDLYYTKRIFWFVFLSIISTTIFIATAFILNFSYKYIILTFLIGIIFSYGLINVSMFVGSYFLKLNWKNPYELCASVGSLCSMLFSITYLTTFGIIIYYLFSYLAFLDLFYKLSCIIIIIFALNLILSSIITKLSLRKLKQKISL